MNRRKFMAIVGGTAAGCSVGPLMQVANPLSPPATAETAPIRRPLPAERIRTKELVFEDYETELMPLEERGRHGDVIITAPVLLCEVVERINEERRNGWHIGRMRYNTMQQATLVTLYKVEKGGFHGKKGTKGLSQESQEDP